MRAEQAGRWDFDPADARVFITGSYLTQGQSEGRKWGRRVVGRSRTHMFNATSGEPNAGATTWNLVGPALARPLRVLHAAPGLHSAELPQGQTALFRRARAGGESGRTWWNGSHYGGRQDTREMLEFPHEERAGALRHFYSRLAAVWGLPPEAPAVGRGGNAAAAPPPARGVLVLNRGVGENRRLGTGAGGAAALRAAIAAALPPGEYDPPVEVTPAQLAAAGPRAMAETLRSTALLVSPHGAQLANMGFLRVRVEPVEDSSVSP